MIFCIDISDSRHTGVCGVSGAKLCAEPLRSISDNNNGNSSGDFSKSLRVLSGLKGKRPALLRPARILRREKASLRAGLYKEVKILLADASNSTPVDTLDVITIGSFQGCKHRYVARLEHVRGVRWAKAKDLFAKQNSKTSRADLRVHVTRLGTCVVPTRRRRGSPVATVRGSWPNDHRTQVTPCRADAFNGRYGKALDVSASAVACIGSIYERLYGAKHGQHHSSLTHIVTVLL
nr:hypothetical protein CFP56_11507 [Quercus suber]